MRAGSLKPEAGSGKYKAYPEYKNSGVEWLGDIPADWKMMRLKQTSSIQTGIAKGKDLSQIEDKIKVPYLRVANVQDGYLKLDDVSEIEIKTEELDRYLLQPGDVLMNEGGDNDKLGRGAVWQGQVKKCIHQNHVFAVRPEIVEPEWLNWLTQSEYAKFHFYRVAKQSTNLASISSTNIGELPMIVPPVVDRRSVINFLFHETAKIDTLIEEQQSLIRLLQEKRQAVISHAVTKGLNPDAPMKDSGVEWLGKVPEHWTVTKLKYNIASMDQGWSPQCDSRPAEADEYGVLKVGCVNGGTFNSAENKALPKELTPRLEYLLKKGQLLISRANTKELVGSAAVVNEDYPNLMVCDKLYRINVNPEVNPAFISLLLGTPAYREQIELGATGASSSMQNIGQNTIRELNLAAPKPDEINAILNYVSVNTSRYDELITGSQSAISFMQERRTALISAAVTGKIDVRDWPPPEQKQKAAV